LGDLGSLVEKKKAAGGPAGGQVEYSYPKNLAHLPFLFYFSFKYLIDAQPGLDVRVLESRRGCLVIAFCSPPLKKKLETGCFWV
jgi:hypothetical protein